MEIGDKVKVIQTKRTGVIIDTQKSVLQRTIYVVKFHENCTEGFFGEELELM